MESIFVSYVLLSFNQEAYIEAAVLSALAQDYDNIEFIFSDDKSRDTTYEKIKSIVARASPRRNIKIIQNRENVGLANHINKILDVVQGGLIVLAAGDDISMPHRTSRLVAEYFSNSRPLLLHSKAIDIDQHGNATGSESPPMHLRRGISALEAVNSNSLYLGATGAWSRELIDKYGGIEFQLAYEDSVMGFRATLEERCHYIDESLVYYRVGVGISTMKYRGAIQMIRKRVSMCRTRLDVNKQRKLDVLRNHPGRADLLEAIEIKLAKLSACHEFYASPFGVPHLFLSKNVAITASAILNEIKFITRTLARAFLNVAKRRT